MTDIELDYDQEKVLSDCSFTLSGYFFAGWATTASGAVVYGNGSNVVNLTAVNGATVTLYAVWESIGLEKYVVVYNANGGSGLMTNSTFDVGETSTLKVNAYERAGYTFTGWALSENGSVIYSDGGSISESSSGQYNLYAVWQANVYTVTLDFNGGTFNNESSMQVSLYYGEEYDITSIVPEKTGYTFNCFTYNNEMVPFVDNYQVPSDITIVASYSANTYTITLDYNGGVRQYAYSDSITVNYGDSYDVSGYVPSKAGYTFNGFKYNNANFGTTGNYYYTEDITVVADYTLNHYTVTFDFNGGKFGNLTTYSTQLTYGEEYDLTEIIPQKTGYQFNYYSYLGEQIPDFGTYEIESDITLVANYSAINYTINFDGNGATDGTMSDILAEYDKAVTLTLNAFTKTNCVFMGWATEADGNVVYGNGEQVINLTANANEIVCLYAVWVQKCNVTINVNDSTIGSVNTAYLTVDYNTLMSVNGNVLTVGTANITATAKVIAGYQIEFLSFTGTVDKITGDVVITANFNKVANSYKIKFDKNGGTGAMADLSMTYDVSKKLTESAFAKEGYNFIGWAMTADGGKAFNDRATVINLTTEQNGEITLYAVWEEKPIDTGDDDDDTGKTYTVKFNKNGGVGSMSSQSVAVGEEVALKQNKFIRPGYIFKGWALTPDGEVEYENGEKIEDIINEGETVTLYAVWELDGKTTASCATSIDNTSSLFAILIIACAVIIVKKKALIK